ncbi:MULTISPECIES: alpha/beta hydrolase-fold protein [unclassified Streptomyces]|uniref:alpha/beta hydrolase n=1 Tax=unclassified Streptomyces TaxID=2593676 RepID=UPI002E7A9ACE|nr:alpha/beta hydrolase-fold protein [Streptomyces sp. JV176]
MAVALPLGLGAWPVPDAPGVFSDTGDPITFAQGGDTVPTPVTERGGGGRPAVSGVAGASEVLMPTGPAAAFTVAATVPEDGSKIAVTTLAGKKSGFTGRVWVWVPPQYTDPAYARSGFPVMIALPGGAGYPVNYWMGTDLKLEASIAAWSKEGRSLPFILAMPVLNPHPDTGGLYWDASDIPGQPKMGTWLTEDVPDLVKANFRTLTSRDGWAIMGSSTGGFAGLKSVLQKPRQFKAALVSGPDLAPDSRLWAGHEQEERANDPAFLAPELIRAKGPDVYLAFQVGTVGSDARTRPKVEDFVRTYTRGPIRTRLSVIQGGGHNARTYVPNMVDAGLIQWISAHMRGPVPAP